MYGRKFLFDLCDVPTELSRFIYEAEQKEGSVNYPGNVFALVLALRAILHCEYGGIEAQRVFGYCSQPGWVDIWLDEPEIKGRHECDPLTQQARRVLMATIGYGTMLDDCSIRTVYVSNATYGRDIELHGTEGVRRLLVDAACGSHAASGFESCDSGVRVDRTRHDGTSVRVSYYGSEHARIGTIAIERAQ